MKSEIIQEKPRAVLHKKNQKEKEPSKEVWIWRGLDKNTYKYMLLTVKNSVANIYKKNNKNSEIVTQILFGENFITNSKSGKFYRGYKAYDKYKGFIETKDLQIDKIKKTHKIISKDCSLYKKPNNKYKINKKIFFNSKISILNKKNNL